MSPCKETGTLSGKERRRRYEESVRFRKMYVYVSDAILPGRHETSGCVANVSRSLLMLNGVWSLPGVEPGFLNIAEPPIGRCQQS